MRFGRSFTQQQHFGGLKMQTFENGFQTFESNTIIVSVKTTKHLKK